MTISWYPGHMNKARKELKKLMTSVQVVIEVLDARTPSASSNPLLNELRDGRPCIKLLNKCDLAVDTVTADWQRYFELETGVLCLLNGLDNKLNTTDLLRAADRLLHGSTSAKRSSKQLVIVGIPNVGKSTLLNQFCQRKLAKTGNEPAVTKAQQRVRLSDQWYLIDTPGMMWPKLEDQQAAARLACTGTIRNTAVAPEDVAMHAAELLLARYRPILIDRYDVDDTVTTPIELLDHIAFKRGSLRRGGHPDLHKTAELLLNDFRSGKLGRLSLEEPPAWSGYRPK